MIELSRGERMKKIKGLLVMLLVMVLATGCVKFNANMDIKKDKSMDFTIIYAIDKTIFGEDGKLKEEDMKEAEKQGFTVSKYSDGNMEGFKLVKKVKNIDEISSEKDEEFDLSGLTTEGKNNGYIFRVVKGEDKNTYYAKFKFNANDSGLNTEVGEDDEEAPNLGDENDLFTTSNGSGDMDFSGLMKNLDLSFTVTLPNGAISNNATTSEDGNKKLTWKLAGDKKENIEFVFELSNKVSSCNTLLYVGIGVGALVLIGVVLALVLKKKNTKPIAQIEESAPQVKE